MRCQRQSSLCRAIQREIAARRRRGVKVDEATFLAQAQPHPRGLRQKLNDEPTGEKPQRMRDGFLRGTEEKMKELDALIERTPAGYLAVVKEIQAEVVDMRRDVADAEA